MMIAKFTSAKSYLLLLVHKERLGKKVESLSAGGRTGKAYISHT